MPLSRLPRFAAFLQGLATLTLLLTPPLLIWAVLAPGHFPGPPGAFRDLPEGEWTLYTWVGVGVVLIPFIFAMQALGAMRRLFGVYRTGDPLAPETGPLIQSIGSNLLCAAGLGLLLQPVSSPLLTLSNPPGERLISLTIGSSDIGFVLVAGLLTLIGWSMAEAQRIAAENREFI
ncbi:hypothetical protein [Roseovarius aestuariivivens]|uniref:hypothetical protein n=1 Tax=Roseovarius aestuariivivens TaxID=1888910 RepID=UPI001080B3AF|nr:hypothetical protein [Roseovarius aestuariivivens]